MNLETMGTSDMVVNIGWTLLHSLWQISLVALGLFALLPLLRRGSANLRYLVSVFALALSCVVPAVTFIGIAQSDASNTAPNNYYSAVPRTRDAAPDAATELRTAGSIDSETRNGIGSASMIFGGLSDHFRRTVANIFPAVVFIWLSGVALCSLRLCGGFWQLRRYRTEDQAKIDPEWTRKLEYLRTLAGLRQNVRLSSSNSLTTPVAVGILKPVIIIPAAMFLNITPRELETVIAHELIHIRRYDPLVNLFQCAAEAILFYHPAVWLISARIRQEREFAADAAVIGMLDDVRVIYARALANLEEIRLRANDQTPRYATAVNGGNLMQRIQRILDTKTEVNRANSAWTAGVAVVLTSAFLLGLFSFNSPSFVNAQKKSATRRLAVGFVSIPPLDRTDNAPKDADATARLLIEKLKTHKIPAIGFLQGGMVSDGEKLFPVRANIARMWRDAGFEIGLGGFRHIHLYDNPVDQYITNIEKNERVAKKLLGDMALPPRFFSYPFLSTGKSVEDKAKVEAWLASRGYTSVKYTFDNSEWMYSFAYDMARNDNDVNAMNEVREQYLTYMGRMFDHYEAYSAEMFGRDIPQTMVLTPSRLITDTADEFFDMAAKRGYTFVSVNEAQSDEAYKTPESFTGKAGISWFERWALAKGSKLRNEPAVDANIQTIWDRRHASSKK